MERVGGLKWRRWADASRRVAVIQTGIGWARAQAACEVVFPRGPWTVWLASGFAGGLAPSRVGELVIPEQVVCQDPVESSIGCHALYRHKACRAARSSAVLSGRLVTVGHIVWLARDKQALARTFDANSLDMESAAIGTTAVRYGIPFFVVRSVSDRVDEDLPLDLNLFCRSDTFVRGLWTVVSTPRMWPAFDRLRRQKNVASAQLTRFFETFFSAGENRG